MRKPGLLTLVACCMLALPAIADNHDESPSVKVTALEGPLYLLQGRGGNVVASVGDDGVLMIDDDYREMAPAYVDALESLAGEGASPAFVLNTHWHLDHTGGNRLWGERGAVIVAHTNVRKRMGSRQEMKAMNRVIEASPASALPVVTFDDSLAVHFNGDDLEVQHYAAGHTDGDSVVYFTGQNVLHMGDLFFNGRFPFVDIGSGGTVPGYKAAVTDILTRVDNATVIVPGHGALANKADLLSYLNMLNTTTALVRDKLAAGESVESIIEEGLGDEWEGWGSGFIDEATWIGFIANSP
ncbi:MBL fold metallo-hydrolase [Kineobactrum sediminis]|uniref:MBL fold metallo-hydrolase n=1 Tax=Kineobactrum sediminis TaxID=1905677 RepID=A0A2N5XXY2_9GAMM|nr:MBL fold metallo-hydrolase [Kineobactrum sediminis]PLW81007.1 MBL fold metallo-hydrolase [Kineobactrum sediminis]